MRIYLSLRIIPTCGWMLIIQESSPAEDCLEIARLQAPEYAYSFSRFQQMRWFPLLKNVGRTDWALR